MIVVSYQSSDKSEKSDKVKSKPFKKKFRKFKGVTTTSDSSQSDNIISFGKHNGKYYEKSYSSTRNKSICHQLFYERFQKMLEINSQIQTCKNLKPQLSEKLLFD